MKQIRLKAIKQSGDSIFAFSNEIINPNKIGKNQKILGNGAIGSFSELHNEMFNAGKQTFGDVDVEIFLNDEKYGEMKAFDDKLEMSPDFPKSIIDKFTKENTVNFKIMKNPIGMYRLKREDEENLYHLENEKYLRDRNGYTDFATKEDMLNTLNYYYEEDAAQNAYTTKQKDRTKVLIEGELFDEFQNRKSLNKQVPDIKNKHSVDRKTSMRPR